MSDQSSARRHREESIASHDRPSGGLIRNTRRSRRSRPSARPRDGEPAPALGQENSTEPCRSHWLSNCARIHAGLERTALILRGWQRARRLGDVRGVGPICRRSGQLIDARGRSPGPPVAHVPSSSRCGERGDRSAEATHSSPGGYQQYAVRDGSALTATRYRRFLPEDRRVR